jgi:cyclophilin family peptidyl-prolyl cis-trans isomerase
VQLLRDDDLATVSWAAFGLGKVCRGHEAEIVPTLVTRAATLAVTLPSGAQRETTNGIAEQSLSWALSRCANREAEHTLRAALLQPGARPVNAALGLTRIAGRRRSLDESSLVSLLDAAAKPDTALATALLPIELLAGLAPSAATRLTDVAQGVLQASNAQRGYAIGALLHGDERADALLADVVTDTSYSVAERSLAVRTLARRQPHGLHSLAATVTKLAPLFENVEQLPQAPWPVLLATLRSLTAEHIEKARRQLRTWTTWQVPDAPDFVRHRVTQARCLSAALLADDNSLSRPLLECDPNGITGALAQIDVLDRAPVTGAHLKQWHGFLAAKQPRVRQAALRLLGGHRELDAAKVLADALRDPHPGTVAAAAQLLAAHPDRASRESPRPGESQIDEQLVSALNAAFERQYAPDQGTVRGALSEAAAALQLLSLKSRIEAFCGDPSTAVRDKAARALVMLGDTSKVCASTRVKPPTATAPAHGNPVTIVFETSSGRHTLTLRPDLAPSNVQRVIDLLAEGFYNQMAIHRAVPGQVVQFGDQMGDGYGGSGREPVVSEPSPQHFGAFSVGMADWGTDSGSSQLFVTLCASPLLDGEYTWLGTASPSWQNVVLDDVILSARVD